MPLEFDEAACPEGKAGEDSEVCLVQLRSGWNVLVQALTPLPIGPNGLSQRISRHYFISHETFERMFGVPAISLKNQSELLLCLEMALDTLEI